MYYYIMPVTIVFIIGLYFLFIGVKAKQAETKRQAGILSIFMAICAFTFCVVETMAHVLQASRSWKHIVSQIELIIGGVWLGIYIVMLIFGHFKLLKRPREISDEASPEKP
jgi:Na+/H+ antiporter NhaC